ncbi:DUF1684 domain-containing protein [Agromyces cerinus]|uniref:DUF1684 domain-containing protein n=1 Tax=Agromyces cerinus subsp. cerinus TaxID=232089 RepID=A0A1N6HZV8_9MICO|nr:DUF1684 domain-containing protein [Agromyces cerinus]SIO25333.1 hypothetical protein SAMN05443544_3526 [Agromyces cerinus subsp. cerinus]
MGEHEFETAFREWQQSRWHAVSAPHGTAALRHTHWLAAEPAEYAGAPGRWHAESANVVGALRNGTEARLAPGEELELDGVRLRAFERDGALALRVIDPDAPSRTSLVAIEAYPPSPERVVTGRFTPAGAGATLDVTSVDGHESNDRLGGAIELEIDGVPVELTVTRDDHGLSAVLADATSGGESYRFRFLRVPEPAADGTVAVDFNRAYLPPCAFSDEYVCPLPPLGNRWPVALRAGERLATRHPLPEVDAEVGAGAGAEVDAA